MHMKRILLTGVLLILILWTAGAQENRHEIGLRYGLSSGISYKMKVDEFRAYKGMLTYREGGLQLTALIESTRPLYVNFTDKLHYYTGLGAHVGFTRQVARRGFWANPFYSSYTKGRIAPVIGMDAIIGLEYRLDRVPLSFAIDAKPFFELFGQYIFRLALFDIGFSIKYSF